MAKPFPEPCGVAYLQQASLEKTQSPSNLLVITIDPVSVNVGRNFVNLCSGTCKGKEHKGMEAAVVRCSVMATLYGTLTKGTFFWTKILVTNVNMQ